MAHFNPCGQKIWQDALPQPVTESGNHRLLVIRVATGCCFPCLLPLIPKKFTAPRMTRRTFVCNSAVAFGLMPTAQAIAGVFTDPTAKPDWLIILIRLNDEQLATLTPYQIREATQPAYGGLKDSDDIPNPQSTADFVRRIACALACPESRYYQSGDLLQQAVLAMRYLLAVQHSDGTIDLLSTNFHSTPDTGFIVKRLCPAYAMLSRAQKPAYAILLDPLKTFLLRAGEGLVVGGIHTPNHRWVVSAALTTLHNIWPDARYVARIEQWLAEHIDMDADGQYNERSTLIYSPLTNRLLITIARGLNKPYLLEYVRRNLNLTRYYLHPNGELVTEASGRQDNARIGLPEGYYYPCRYLALRDKNGEMAALCRQIEQQGLVRLVGYLDYFLNDPTVWADLPPSQPLPVNYVKPYPLSGLVRIRRGDWDCTLLAKNPVWLTFHKGDAVLQGIRLATSFFGKGQFQSEEVVQQNDRWVLTQSLEGPYYQPYPPKDIPADGDWEKMPRTNRAQSEIQQLKTTITLREQPDGVAISIGITGTAGVPVAMELIFRPGGTIAGVEKHPTRPNAWLLSETGTYTVQKQTLTFGPGKALHKNVQLRGSLPGTDAPTVYLTAFTPFEHTLRLR